MDVRWCCAATERSVVVSMARSDPRPRDASCGHVVLQEMLFLTGR